ncbi:MAG TPA: HmuY family protein [Bacteroidia bacterium]
MKLRFYIISILLLSSCFKEEIPVPRKDRGPAVSTTVEMGITYDLSYYISLSQGKTTAVIDKFTWDIAFYGDSNNAHIKLNTGKSMYAYKSEKTDFKEPIDTAGMSIFRLNDYPCGSSDSMALSGILENNKVYIIDRGMDVSFQKESPILFKAYKASDGYHIQYCNFNLSGFVSMTIPYKIDKNYTLFKFSTAKILDEPNSNDWEFKLTQYQHVYYDPFQTYSVVGCIINPRYVQAAIYKGNKSFEQIYASDLNNVTYSSREDIIGFSWKYYNLNNNLYVIRPEKTYFIKHKDGRIYKLHFIGFYNNSGEKGSPTFEYIEL